MLLHVKTRKTETPMTELERLLKWLFDACFGRVAATTEQIGAAIHRVGTLTLKK
jgi:hypothetical protein